MTAAVRKTPDSTNGTPPYDGLDYQRKVNSEVGALWQCVPTRLVSVAGTNDITAASDTSLVAAISAYARPMAFWLTPVNINTGGMTINIDGVGVTYLKDNAGVALAAGAVGVNTVYLIFYDGNGFRVVANGGTSGNANTAPDMILRDEKTTGTIGGAFTSGSFAKRTLNTAVRNVLSGASLSASQFTLQAGTYYIEWGAPGYAVDKHQSRLFNATDATTVETGTSEASAALDGTQTFSRGCAVVTITSAKAFEVDHICQTTYSQGLGIATNLAAKEVYAWVNIWKVGSLPSSANGIPGGGVNWQQTFSATTTDADPGDGFFRLNNATQNAATTVYFDLSDIGLTDITAILDALDDLGWATARGHFKFVKYDDPTKWLIFLVTGSVTTASGYRKVSISNIASSAASPFTGGDRINVSFSAVGRGTDVGLRYTFSTTTTASDPGSGFVRANNATLSSATQLYISETDGDANAVASIVALWDDSASANKALIRIYDPATPTNFAVFQVNGSITDNGAWDTIPVSYVTSGGSLGPGLAIRVDFSIVGDKGSTGSASSSSNFILNGIISPPQITADQNDYSPTGFATACVLRLNSDASRNITGLNAGSNGEVKFLHNNGSNDIVLKNANGSSSAANRFELLSDLTLSGADVCVLQYDGTSARWRAIGGRHLNLAQAFSALQTFNAGIAVNGTNATTNNQNGGTTIDLTNTSAGSSASASYTANNGTNSFSFGIQGTGKTPFGFLAAGIGYVGNTGDVAMYSLGGKIMWSADGSLAEQMRLFASGGLSLGNTTDPGAGIFRATNGVIPGSFTVAGLPAGVTGKTVFCSNCRVFNGAGTQEGAGVGTGGLVTYNGTAWKIAGTNVTAVA